MKSDQVNSIEIFQQCNKIGLMLSDERFISSVEMGITRLAVY